MENKYIVYKITCLVNNKIYIGYTKRTAKERLSEHFRCAKKKSAINTKFAKAILKHGRDNFIIETLFVFDNKEEALQKEIELIEFFNSIKEGYNTRIGGIGGPTIQKHADFSGHKNPMYGKTHTINAINKIIEAHKGKKLSKKTIIKLRLINKGENNNNSKLTENDVIKIRELHFENRLQKKDIALMFNVKPACISKICNYVTWKDL